MRTPAGGITMTAKSWLGAGGVLLLTLLVLGGCASDWWTVDPSAYHPPEQSASETAVFATRAPVGESKGTGDTAEAGKVESGGEEATGDPSFQPRPTQ
jgi:hypothetical protein